MTKLSGKMACDQTLDPEKIVKGLAAGLKMLWSLDTSGCPKKHTAADKLREVKKRMTDNLEVGNPIICAMGAGDFTSSGHYIVLVGLKDGKFIVNDPNSPENSQKLWSYEQIQGQIRNLWVIR